MDHLARTIRLVTGLGMIAAGTSLTAPAAIEMHRWWQANAVPPPPTTGRASASESGSPTARPAAGELGGPDSWAAPGETPAQVSDLAGTLPLDRNYVLPQPPAPLPPVASPPPQAAAALATAYRSTLEVPPPPLLDGHQPPPPGPGWSGRQPDHVQRPVGPTPHSMVYVIRDGDDLTGIAARFYGHPAAAAAIWEANRGVLPDPGILPIGGTILLPHPDSMAGLAPAGSRPPVIEPAGFSGRFRAVGRTSP